MNDENQKRYVIYVSIILMLIWLIIIARAYTSFQDNRLTEPLAEIESLYPGFFIIISLFSILCFWTYKIGINDKILHIILLVEFACMLWLTPYLMSGLGREPDGIWHAAVSLNIPEILNGEVASLYANNYPFSYIFNYSFQVITSTQTIPYASIVFPITILVIFIIFDFRPITCHRTYLVPSNYIILPKPF